MQNNIFAPPLNTISNKRYSNRNNPLAKIPPNDKIPRQIHRFYLYNKGFSLNYTISLFYLLLSFSSFTQCAEEIILKIQNTGPKTVCATISPADSSTTGAYYIDPQKEFTINVPAKNRDTTNFLVIRSVSAPDPKSGSFFPLHPKELRNTRVTITVAANPAEKSGIKVLNSSTETIS